MPQAFPPIKAGLNPPPQGEGDREAVEGVRSGAQTAPNRTPCIAPVARTLPPYPLHPSGVPLPLRGRTYGARLNGAVTPWATCTSKAFRVIDTRV